MTYDNVIANYKKCIAHCELILTAIKDRENFSVPIADEAYSTIVNQFTKVFNTVRHEFNHFESNNTNQEDVHQQQQKIYFLAGSFGQIALLQLNKQLSVSNTSINKLTLNVDNKPTPFNQGVWRPLYQELCQIDVSLNAHQQFLVSYKEGDEEGETSAASQAETAADQPLKSAGVALRRIGLLAAPARLAQEKKDSVSENEHKGPNTK